MKKLGYHEKLRRMIEKIRKETGWRNIFKLVKVAQKRLKQPTSQVYSMAKVALTIVVDGRRTEEIDQKNIYADESSAKLV